MNNIKLQLKFNNEAEPTSQQTGSSNKYRQQYELRKLLKFMKNSIYNYIEIERGEAKYLCDKRNIDLCVLQIEQNKGGLS